MKIRIKIVVSFVVSFVAGQGILRAEAKTQNAFVVVIPSYNNAKYYEKNLDSVFGQTYQNYRIIYVDDASSDNTGELVAAYLRKNGLEDRVTFIQNEENSGALFSMYQAVHSCDDREIIVTLDGDDWLADESVLSYLNEVYSDPHVWLTYGQFRQHPKGHKGFCRAFPKEIIRKNGFRDHAWVSSHLRTFYTKLFKQIKLEDLLYKGKFYKAACDVAQLFPMLEMAGEHIRFIPRVLYIYNRENPISVSRVKRKQQTLGKTMRSYRRYSPLKQLFDEK